MLGALSEERGVAFSRDNKHVLWPTPPSVPQVPVTERTQVLPDERETSQGLCVISRYRWGHQRELSLCLETEMLRSTLDPCPSSGLRGTSDKYNEDEFTVEEERNGFRYNTLGSP